MVQLGIKGQVPGFTLLELTVVIVILGVLLAIFVPQFNSKVSGNEIKTTARNIASDIRYVQQLSLSHEHAGYKIRFYTENQGNPNTYRLYTDRNDGSNYEEKVLSDRMAIVGTNFNSNTIWFNARGTVVQGGTVTLRDDSERWKYIKVQPVTGRVQIGDSP